MSWKVSGKGDFFDYLQIPSRNSSAGSEPSNKEPQGYPVRISIFLSAEHKLGSSLLELTFLAEFWTVTSGLFIKDARVPKLEMQDQC
jgi:hypothetical protein